MNRSMPRPYRVYFYAFFTALWLVGLMQVSTINPTSQSAVKKA